MLTSVSIRSLHPRQMAGTVLVHDEEKAAPFGAIRRECSCEDGVEDCLERGQELLAPTRTGARDGPAPGVKFISANVHLAANDARLTALVGGGAWGNRPV